MDCIQFFFSLLNQEKILIVYFQTQDFNPEFEK